MTEGIVQKAFSKYLPQCPYDGELLKIIKQELIEEIKQLNEYYTIKGCGMDAEVSECRLLEELIGDTE